MKIQLRKAETDDCRRFYEWANDPVVRKYSRNPQPIAWETHVVWFEKILGEGKSRIFVLTEREIPVGQMRFDPIEEGVWEISLGLAPEARGKGLGIEALRLGAEYAKNELQIPKIFARVRVENLISLAAFSKAGYRVHRMKMENHFPFYHMYKNLSGEDESPVALPLKIHCEGDAQKGLGHVKRCLSLASACRELGWRPIEFYLSKDSEIAAKEIIEQDFPVHPLPINSKPEEIAERMLPEGKALVLVDRYWSGLGFHQKVKERGGKVAAIDDTGQEKFDVDLLINPNLAANSFPYETGRKRILLLGEEFALLNKNFSQRKSKPRDRSAGNHLLITFGGSDPKDLTATVLRALLSNQDSTLTSLEIQVVLGAGYKGKARTLEKNWKGKIPKPKFLSAANDLAEIMNWADLAITAAGTTAYEAASQGLPSIHFVIAENQKSNAEGFAEKGISIYGGEAEKLSEAEFIKQLLELYQDKDKRTQMSQRGTQFVDTRGAARTAHALFALSQY